MVQLNFGRGEVQCKIVYYGPSGSGKTQNLRSIHERTPPHVRGDLTTITTDANRTLFFDLLPLDLGKIAGTQTKVALYAAPFNPEHPAVRMLVLEGVDGIVFVADRDPNRIPETIGAFQELRDNLQALGRDLDDIPIVFQWNKSDVEGGLKDEQLAQALGLGDQPWFSACALKGEGVFSTLKAITQAVLADIAAAKEKTEAPRADEGIRLDGALVAETPVNPVAAAMAGPSPAGSNQPVPQQAIELETNTNLGLDTNTGLEELGHEAPLVTDWRAQMEAAEHKPREVVRLDVADPADADLPIARPVPDEEEPAAEEGEWEAAEPSETQDQERLVGSRAALNFGAEEQEDWDAEVLARESGHTDAEPDLPPPPRSGKRTVKVGGHRPYSGGTSLPVARPVPAWADAGKAAQKGPRERFRPSRLQKGGPNSDGFSATQLTVAFAVTLLWLAGVGYLVYTF